jgi:hypothetical protein
MADGCKDPERKRFVFSGKWAEMGFEVLQQFQRELGFDHHPRAPFSTADGGHCRSDTVVGTLVEVYAPVLAGNVSFRWIVKILGFADPLARY